MPESDSSFHDESELVGDPHVPSEPLDATRGNRPAAGARHVSPGEVLNNSFDGSANAGDFLGLDVEMGEPAPGGGLELSEVDPYGTSQAVTTAESGGEEVEDPYEEEGESPDGVEGDDDLIESLEEAPAPSKVPLYAGVAFAVGLLAVGAAVLAPKYLGKNSTPAQVASNTSGPAVPRSVTTTTPTARTTTTATPTSVVSPVDPTPDPEPTAEPSSGATQDTVADGGGETAKGGGVSLGMDLLRRLAGGGAPDPGTESVSAVPGATSAPIAGQTFDPSLFSAEAWMSGDLVDMIWRDTSVPMEAIRHPARIMTPRVGQVRVRLDSGESLEGRLYAVGQNRVWIEGDMGRLGIDGDRVESLEPIHTEVAHNASFDPTTIGSGQRVRVQVPGGVLYGRVLSVVDEHVTLVTDGGARVTLDSPDIEPLGPSRAVLVER